MDLLGKGDEIFVEKVEGERFSRLKKSGLLRCDGLRWVHRFESRYISTAFRCAPSAQ